MTDLNADPLLSIAALALFAGSIVLLVHAWRESAGEDFGLRILALPSYGRSWWALLGVASGIACIVLRRTPLIPEASLDALMSYAAPGIVLAGLGVLGLNAIRRRVAPEAPGAHGLAGFAYFVSAFAACSGAALVVCGVISCI